MNLRTDWNEILSNEFDEFYTREETIQSVVDNFNLRRQYGAEGYPLTIGGKTDRCLVQTSSNPLRQVYDYRKICVPIDMPVYKGDYVTYENNTWLVDTNVVNVDGAYYTTRMSRCKYLLKWQNAKGEIVERWCVKQDASAYNSGVEGNRTIQLGSDQIMVYVPYDKETIKLRRDKRFFFDLNTEEPMSYKITRPDTTTEVFDGHGFIILILNESQASKNDRIDLMVCDYFEPAEEETPSNSELRISCNSTKLYLGSGGYRTATATLVDKNGEEVADATYTWSIIPEVANLVEYTIDNKTLKIKALDNESAAYTTVTATCRSNGKIASITFTIQEVG